MRVARHPPLHRPNASKLRSLSMVGDSATLTELALFLLNDRIDVPLTRDAFERIGAALGEQQIGVRELLAQVTRDQDLACLRLGHYPRRGVHIETADLLAAHLAFAVVQPDPNGDTDPLESGGQRPCAAD